MSYKKAVASPEEIEIIVLSLRRYKELAASSPSKKEKPQLLSLTELQSYYSPSARIRRLEVDAVREALTGFVRDVGWSVYVRGGSDAMFDVLTKVEGAMQTDQDFARAILDEWWKGFGSWQ